jgi:hypothetical protein
VGDIPLPNNALDILRHSWFSPANTIEKPVTIHKPQTLIIMVHIHNPNRVPRRQGLSVPIEEATNLQDSHGYNNQDCVEIEALKPYIRMLMIH